MDQPEQAASPALARGLGYVPIAQDASGVSWPETVPAGLDARAGDPAATPPGRPWTQARHRGCGPLRPIGKIVAEVVENCRAGRGAGARGELAARAKHGTRPGSRLGEAAAQCAYKWPADTMQRLADDLVAGRITALMATLFLAKLTLPLGSGQLCRAVGMTGAALTFWRRGGAARIDALDRAAAVLGMRLALAELGEGAPIIDPPGGWVLQPRWHRGTSPGGQVVRQVGRQAGDWTHDALAEAVREDAMVPAMAVLLARMAEPKTRPMWRRSHDIGLPWATLDRWRSGFRPNLPQFEEVAAMLGLAVRLRIMVDHG